jgi:hypothetical protein
VSIRSAAAGPVSGWISRRFSPRNSIDDFNLRVNFLLERLTSSVDPLCRPAWADGICDNARGAVTRAATGDSLRDAEVEVEAGRTKPLCACGFGVRIS